MSDLKNDLKNVPYIKQFFGEYLDLRKDKDNEALIVESIRNGVEFKGTNLWILIFAIFIASLGLNVNSTAVIIGAMLISPLMGPIMGVGLAIGQNDFELLKRSLKSYLVATVFSVITSTIYFSLTPLDEVQSELLARTSPTIYDVLIRSNGVRHYHSGYVAIVVRRDVRRYGGYDYGRSVGGFGSDIVCSSGSLLCHSENQRLIAFSYMKLEFIV